MDVSGFQENLDTKDIDYSKSVLFRKTVELLLLSIEDKAEKSPEAILEDIAALSELLGEVVERALDVVDNHQITLFQSESGERELLEIRGGSSVYRLFSNIAYCSCQSFHKQVIRGTEFCCKHYIACRIAKALGKVAVVEKSLPEFRQLLKPIQF